MKFQAILRNCVSVVVVLLISMSLFAAHAFAFDESAVKQLKNNYDLPNTSLNDTKVSPDVVNTPSLSHQEPILLPDERLNSGKKTAKIQNEPDYPLQVCSKCNCEQPSEGFCEKCCPASS
ncbi:MAG: hypothetical protein ACYT04_39800 [Nostoc sp.]